MQRQPLGRIEDAPMSRSLTPTPPKTPWSRDMVLEEGVTGRSHGPLPTSPNGQKRRWSPVSPFTFLFGRGSNKEQASTLLLTHTVTLDLVVCVCV